MAKINLDISQNVDIICRAGDSFSMDMSITNSDGSAYEFSDDEYVFLSVHDYSKNPICIFSNTVDIDDLPIYEDLYTADRTNLAEALRNLLKSRKLVKKAWHDLVFFSIESEYEGTEEMWVLPKISWDTGGSIIPSITLSSGNINIETDSIQFDVPVGKYGYEIKIASNLIDNSEVTNLSSIFGSARTWMRGSFIVKKD
jgi:hypothetical protein